MRPSFPDYEAWGRARWCAVYGAVFALELRDVQRLGGDPTDPESCQRIKEEAAAQADLEADGADP